MVIEEVGNHKAPAVQRPDFHLKERPSIWALKLDIQQVSPLSLMPLKENILLAHTADSSHGLVPGISFITHSSTAQISP